MRRASCIGEMTRNLLIANRPPYIKIWASGHIEHTMISSRPNRSDSYQWKIAEISADHDTLSLNAAAEPINELCKELQDAATARVLLLIDKVATPQQQQITKLMLSGLTQSETNHALGEGRSRCNSSVFKALKGSHVYENGKMIGRHGGIAKKLLAACLRVTNSE